MSDIFKKMQKRALDIIDPNVNYTQEDFYKEFNVESTMNNSNFKKEISFVNKSNNPNPEYATSGSSGFDLRAFLTDGPTYIKPNEITIVPTGLYFDIPENYEIQVRPRSGLAAKYGITVLNSPGTVDSDYTGMVKVILINHSSSIFKIENGDRIAQAVIATVINKNIIDLVQVDEFSKETERSSGGFGSTGLQ